MSDYYPRSLRILARSFPITQTTRGELELFGRDSSPLSDVDSLMAWSPPPQRSPSPVFDLPTPPPPPPTPATPPPEPDPISPAAKHALTVRAIKKLARKGGIMRMESGAHMTVRQALVAFVNQILRDTLVIVDSHKGEVVTAMDIVVALKRQGRTSYGFDKYVAK